MPAEGGQNSSLDTDSFPGSFMMLELVVASVVKKLLCIPVNCWGSSVIGLASIEVDDVPTEEWGFSVVILASSVVEAGDLPIEGWGSSVTAMALFLVSKNDPLVRECGLGVLAMMSPNLVVGERDLRGDTITSSEHTTATSKDNRA